MTRRFTGSGLEIRPDERRVLVAGEPAALGARAFDVLMLLVEHRDRVVTKSELLQKVWPTVVVDENNLSVHVAALRKLLGTDAIATVSGRGYRWVRALELHAPAGLSPQPAAPADVPAEGPAPGPAVALAQPAAAPASAGIAEAPALRLPDRPSLAVLPFDNLSGDTQQDVVVDGITEDVITELARFRSLFVIARDSSFGYRHRAVDVRTVARELGVRYVLHGSFRRGGARVRVVAHLADASEGTQLWAERFDATLEDLFTLQEALTRAIVAAIAPQVEAGEIRRLRALAMPDLAAYEQALHARDLARRADTTGDTVARGQALQLAREAVARDPRCPIARTTIAFVLWQQLWAGSTPDPSRTAAEGLAAAREAIALDAADHAAYLWKGMLLIFAGEHRAGLEDLARAHELNPNDALTLSLLGQFGAVERDAAQGVERAREALRLSPRDPLRWSYLNSLAWALLAARAHEEAAQVARQSIAEAAALPPSWLCLALAEAGAGRQQAALEALQQLRERAPQLLQRRLAGEWIYANPDFVARATATLRDLHGRAG